MDIEQIIAEELGARPAQVGAAIALLDDGATVPFIARYRKEVTGGLDDTQLRLLESRLAYLRDLEERRRTILRSIEEQGQLTTELKGEILAADTKTRLEDLYLPFKPKRRTRAQIAREAGLEPLLDTLLEDPAIDPERHAEAFVDADKGVADIKAALEGARHIFIERAAQHAGLLGELRELVWNRGHLCSSVVEGKERDGAKFSDYFDHREPLAAIPSHRLLALLRGRKEGVLRLALQVEGQSDEPAASPGCCEARIAATFGIRQQGRAADRWLQEAVRWAWRVKLAGQLELELVNRAREAAEAEAIRVFGDNLRDLLLAAPAGERVTLGLDPGLRTGVKAVVVDATGKLLEHTTLYPHEPRRQWDASIATLAALCTRHKVELVAIGNGTASRETDRLVVELRARHPELGLQSVMVSEAGASVYSASELAAREFPDLDVSFRGAVSIARRLQDPLAELVKIDPRSIGVGQYQHDVSQVQLGRTLDAVVEDCVNAVGVDVNTASAPLLARVAGLTPTLAANVVAHRDSHGPFRNRKELLKVSRLGPRAFEQAAGFLRIRGGDNPLDGSAVHPEAYPVVERIVRVTGRTVESLIGDRAFLSSLAANDFTDERFGEPTVRDILGELEKPGRDPRPEFRTAVFQEGVNEIADLKEGMVLEGVVTNVTNFGAFVDVGVHQDGLVHISKLSDRFVKDPREVVKAGDVVKVKVVSVDLERRRIGLSMRLDERPEGGAGERGRPAGERKGAGGRGRGRPKPRRQSERPATAMADAFARLRKG
ncbi:MAG TPA: RNA-binding transcriptional accessory protein [Thiotrichales bacterium]|nr:RNA-binding transcriptional accessory protein [Thiotrichales bacterium]